MHVQFRSFDGTMTLQYAVDAPKMARLSIYTQEVSRDRRVYVYYLHITEQKFSYEYQLPYMFLDSEWVGPR
jgi:hypothetical protein